MSCEIEVHGDRHSGIVLDVSASGLFVQTNVKPTPGTFATLRLSLPGERETVTMRARVARKKTVPPQLLAVAGGGLGFAIMEPAEAYLDFVAEISPEHAEAVALERAKAAQRKVSGAAVAKPPQDAGGGRPSDRKREQAPKRYRIHAVETSSGRRNTYLVTCASEQEASDQVLEQLGDAWKVLFIERA